MSTKNCTTLIDKAVVRPLLGWVIGYKGMPTYPSCTWNDCPIHIMPHALVRKFIRSIPFYNGSLASFDISISIPRNKTLTYDIRYVWSLHFKGIGIHHEGEGQEPNRTGEGIIPITEIRRKPGVLKMWGSGLLFMRKPYETIVNHGNAIDCGYLLGERGDYEIKLHLSDGHSNDLDSITAQFELRNIDEWHSQYIGFLLSALFGAIAGLLASIIWLAIKGGGLYT